MNVKRQIWNHIDEAQRLALAEIERMARELLRKHRELDEFIMAMGSATFSLRAMQNTPTLLEYFAQGPSFAP